MSRPTWDDYFMNIAKQAATRSTCERKHVGAVIVRDKTILSTGYNGSIRGMPHCDDAGHMMENDHCVATIHAEANAIIQAAKHGVNINSINGAGNNGTNNNAETNKDNNADANDKGNNNDNATTIYTTASPCWSCFKLIANSGIKRIVFGEFYRDQRIFDVSQKIGIELVDMTKK